VFVPTPIGVMSNLVVVYVARINEINCINNVSLLYQCDVDVLGMLDLERTVMV
jgi:hypothetical protein